VAEVRVGEPYQAAYPDHYGAAVTLTLSDGSTRRAEVPDALGDPENPLSPDRVRAKARDLMALAGAGPGTVETLLAAVADLPQAPDLARFDAAFAALCADLEDRTETA
jgi:2-methylcitrate dehydratase PrpD